MGDQRATVFVIDDDPSVREAVQDLVRTVGLEARLFATPREFLQTKRPDSPACVVLDVRLPEMSGLAFQQELVKTGVTLPVIFLTAHGDLSMGVRAMKAGAFEFMTKPFNDRELLGAIHTAIEHDRLRWRARAAELQERSAARTDREREIMGAIARRDLFGSLERAARVTLVSAPAGSGKTVLLRSWIEHAGLQERAAWLSIERDEHDIQKFWTEVLQALRCTIRGSLLVRALDPTPSFDGWAIVERLLADLAALDEQLWLVLNDLHELRSEEALRQLELLLLRAPKFLRFVILTRHDLRLGLHRLRLQGELTEIRGSDLRFTLEEARLLLDAAGVRLSDRGLELLVERTEGWAAGLRLAALSLARHPDPERFAADFSGSERTIAEYLLAEVLDRQSQDVRRLLLQTSLLERVSGPLADALTGGYDGERILQDLEDSNAFVVSLDSSRTWFRYHRLFADLLQLELRRTAATEIPKLHSTAATWYAAHGYLIDAIRHAQAAGDWKLATALLSDHYFTLKLDGQGATAQEILTRFPPHLVAADPELGALTAASELDRGSLDEAERHLARAVQTGQSLPEDRKGRFAVLLAILRLSLARQRGDLPAVINESERLLAAPESQPNQSPLSGDRRALAIISLGVAESNIGRHEDAQRHLKEGAALAQRIGRPYLQAYALAFMAPPAVMERPHRVAVETAMRAIELARRHGWGAEPMLVPAYQVVSVVRMWQGRWNEADEWLELASRAIRPEVDPGQGEVFYLIRGELELMRGRYAEALAALEAGERLAQMLAAARPLSVQSKSALMLTLLKLGEIERVEQRLAKLTAEEKRIGGGQLRLPLAALHFARGDARATRLTLAPLLDRTAQVYHNNWLVVAFLLEAIACAALGDPVSSTHALERALDLAEPDGVLSAFLLYPAAELLERHRGRRTAHAALISEILDRLTQADAQPARVQGRRLREPLSDSETRVLRYLPTNLSAPEIAEELHVSVHTVKTHLKHLYAKLSVHERSEAVKEARVIGLLAPSREGPTRASL
jgi:LuxR family maltose regulon positive regulatory protein